MGWFHSNEINPQEYLVVGKKKVAGKGIYVDFLFTKLETTLD
jgi:hypothetical protein